MSQTHATVLGFDYGMEKIGVAVGQSVTRTTSPLTIVSAHHGKPDWPTISRLIQEWQPSELVVGIPFNMDGSSSPMTGSATRFANQLGGRYGLPVHRIDERLSTIEAEHRLRDRPSGGPRKRANVDHVAAQVILETWFSELPDLDVKSGA
jgi:putative Holliday junction resolvase